MAVPASALALVAVASITTGTDAAVVAVAAADLVLATEEILVTAVVAVVVAVVAAVVEDAVNLNSKFQHSDIFIFSPWTMSIRVQTRDGLILSLMQDKAEFLPSLSRRIRNANGTEVFRLSNITAVVLEKVLEWCSRHAKLDDSLETLMEWDQKFFDENKGLIGNIGEAADYFEIGDLKNAICEYNSLPQLCN
nr:hypothetical protein HmN_000126800 [Hymenolepis microstoma]